MLVADLHIHSTASDGCTGPELIPRLAARAGLSHIAITDHDTLDGIAAAQAEARRCGIDVVPGVEMSTLHEGRGVHMLGYFCDPADTGLAAAFEYGREQRARRACAVADRLAEDGYPVNSAELLACAAKPSRPALARLLVDQGVSSSVDAAFEEYLGKGTRYYVEAEQLETVDAMRAVQSAGGFAFIAHPAHYHVVDLIPALAGEGLHGVEAYHSMHDGKQAEQLVCLAHDMGLAVSGGSDWHGDDTHGATLGGSGLDERGLRSFLAACGRELE